VSTSLTQWTTLHDQAVTLHLVGWKPDQIAETLDQSVGWVVEVVKSDRAMALSKQLQKRVRTRLLESLEDQMVGLGELAVMNLKETMQSHVEVGTPEKRHQDKMSLEILKLLKSSDALNELMNRASGGFSKELEKRLATALELSNQIDQMMSDKHEVFRELQREANGQVMDVEYETV
jgi:hypothetical protein